VAGSVLPELFSALEPGEADLAHNAADTGVVEDGDDELLKLRPGGDLLGCRAGAPALVGLRNAVASALDNGDTWFSTWWNTAGPGPPTVARRLSATLKQSLSALHWSG
jgi:hypothetical protein